MQIQRLPQSNQPKLLNTPTPPNKHNPMEEKWDKVTFDKATNTYHFEKPGYHYSARRQNPVTQGLTGAALFGIPAAVGAAEHAWLGGAAATGVTALISPGVGAIGGGCWAGKSAYEATGKNPFYTTLAAGGGALAGMIAFPLLKLPGVWFGTTGAIAAAAGVGIGSAIWTAVNNNKLDNMAQAAGYRPE